MLQGFDFLALDAHAADRAGQLRASLEPEGLDIGLVDSAIAAIALQAGEALATRNGAHFRRVPGLEVTGY